MIIACPMWTPCVAPAKVSAKKGIQNSVATILVLIRSDPVEIGVKVHVPCVAHAATENLQLRAIRSTAQYAAFGTPIVRRIVVSVLIRLT